MTYKVTLSKRASTYLSRLPQKTATRILDKLELLKSDPFHAPDTKALEGKLKDMPGQMLPLIQTAISQIQVG